MSVSPSTKGQVPIAHLKHAEPLGDEVGLTPAQVTAGLELMQWLIRERPADGEAQLARMYDRYINVPPPESGKRHSVWYRTRIGACPGYYDLSELMA